MDKGAERSGTGAELDILRLMLDGARDALYAVELPAVRMIHASPAFPARLGLGPDFLERGFDFADYLAHVHVDDRERVQGIMARILASRSDAELPENPARYRTGPPGGPWRHMEDHYRVLRAPDGSPTMIFGNSRDATDEADIREALRQSEEHYRQLVEAWPEQVMLTVNLTAGRHEYVSPSMERVLGYAPQEFYDDPGLGLAVVAPHWLEEAHAWLDELRRGVVRPPFEFELVRKDGRTIWIHQVCSLRPRQPGQDIVVQFAFRDITAERAASETLRQSEERYRQLAEGWADQVVMRINLRTGRHEYVSPSAERVFGYAPRRFYEGDPEVLGAVAPEWREQARLWLEEAAAGTLRPEYEYEVFDAWGRRRWVRQRGVLIHGADGQPLVVQFLLLDVTEEKRLALELSASKERYRQLAESWHDQVVFRYHLPSMEYEYVSPSVERILGYRPEQFYAKEPVIMNALLPEWREKVAEWVDENRRGILRPEYEYEVLDAWGGRRWLKQHGTLLRGADGAPVALQFLMADATEHKRLEEELRRSRAFLEHVIEQSPVSLWISDEHGTLIRTNRALRERLKIRDEEVMGRFNIFQDEQATQQGHMPAIRRVFEQGGSARFELVYDTARTGGLDLAEHARCVLDFTISAVQDEAGRTTNLIIQHVDISDQKRAEEELRRKDALLSAMLRNLPFDFWARDTAGHIIMQSDESVRLWGDLSGLEVDDQRFSAETQSLWRENNSRVLAGEVVSEERTLSVPGGEARTFHNIVAAIRDGETHLGLLGVNIDITDRKATEEALRATNERYNLLAENVEDVIWTLDERMRWTFLTPSIEVLTGYSLAEFMARPFEQSFTPESMPPVAEALRAWAQARPGTPEGDGSRVLEMALLRSGGGSVPIEVLAQPLRDEAGAIVGYCGTARDITQRKAAEEALQRSERRFSELFRHSSDSICILSSEGVQMFVSGATERMIGYSPAELVGIPVIETMIHPEDREAVRDAFAVAIRHGVGRVQYRHRHKDGSWVHLEAWGTNQLDNPDIRGVVVNVRDITDRKLAEAALQRSERLFRKLLESMHEGVWAFDSHYRTIFANERLGAMLGYTLEELVRKTPWEITDPEQAGLVHSTLAQRRAGIAGTTEYHLVRKDGSRLLAQVTSSPLMDEQGDFEGQVCGIVDLTSRQRLEREVRRNQARLEALFELSRFTGATEVQIASFTLEQALALSESAAGVLFFVGPDGRTLEPRAAQGAGLSGPPPRFMAEGDNLWGQVAASGVPAIVNEDRSGTLSLPEGHPEVRRFLGVPALDGGRSVAVLGLTGKAGNYDEAEVLQLSLLVDGMWRIVRARRDEESIRASLREKEALLREVHHRVKNNLQVVSSLLDMSGRRLSEPEARRAMAEVQAKVQAMSLIHILLYGSGDGRGIHLGEYVGALFRQLREVYGGAGLTLSARLHLGGLVLGLDQAVPLGLALNEALANVFKHAASGQAGQSVEVRAEGGDDGVVTLTVRDQGPGLPPGMDPEGSPGLGMRLMRGLVVHQLGGELSIENAPEGGVVVTLRFRPSGEQAAPR